ncbi:vitamin B6 photo-protection and homoeostasis-domain-containing protein [Halteromyces radiatus]|uniref:vitamin B6 photo-protection and homoeostasis-domain-containing protein n=1 Tax=Halteromyces radiatus TaxID=101107 RepID=UPI00221ED851|nr:vitamin B6 photo-protection and homoeostasis-domain-containing protein [Halteromyces radiatus]KAI8088893.1 vitamin B6 photo-protection and homoeostasis-domain-containing protein [Halteromyces radiatus]
MFELIHESIWIASHLTFTKHFSLNGNIGDIVAKDDAQMSTAHLLGMLSGVGLITISHSPAFLFGVFAVLSPINIWSTIKTIDAAKFEVLNQAKLTLLCREFIETGQVLDYDQLRPKEIGFGEWIKPGKGNNIKVHIKMGPSAEEAYNSVNEIQVTDVMKSVLHAIKFHDQLAANHVTKDDHWDTYLTTLDETLDWTKNHFQPFLDSLDKHDWKRENVYWNDTGMRLTWDGRVQEQTPSS